MVSMAAGSETGSAATSAQLMTSHPGHLRGEPPGKDIADRGCRDRGEQQEVAGGERAAALAQRERDHQRGAGNGRDPEQRLRPLMGDENGDKGGGDRERAHHHAAMRGIDGLNRNRHQERKQDADAERGDRELKPQPARRKRPPQHDQQRERTEPGDRASERGHGKRIDCRDRDACRRQRAAEDRHADEAEQEAEMRARQ
jgi:hypothetical protein